MDPHGTAQTSPILSMFVLRRIGPFQDVAELLPLARMQLGSLLRRNCVGCVGEAPEPNRTQPVLLRLSEAVVVVSHQCSQAETRANCLAIEEFKGLKRLKRIKPCTCTGLL